MHIKSQYKVHVSLRGCLAGQSCLLRVDISFLLLRALWRQLLPCIVYILNLYMYIIHTGAGVACSSSCRVGNR